MHTPFTHLQVRVGISYQQIYLPGHPAQAIFLELVQKAIHGGNEFQMSVMAHSSFFRMISVSCLSVSAKEPEDVHFLGENVTLVQSSPSSCLPDLPHFCLCIRALSHPLSLCLFSRYRLHRFLPSRGQLQSWSN